MESLKVEFFYDGQKIDIMCSEKEKMKNVVEKFCIKVRVDKNSIYCLYAGKILDENITLETLIKTKSKNEKIAILVYPKDKQDEEPTKKIVKASHIICPECQDIASIKINKYKISINCINNHNKNNILLKDFENSQKIDESKIICNECKQNNKSNSFNKEFFMCLICMKNLCPLCRSSHNKNHNIIRYDQKNYICFEHGENYSSYCKTCKKNLCLACEVDHSEHDTISLGKLFPNKKELNKKMSELKENINKLKEEIKKLIDILNAFMENMDIYFNINNDINNSFNIKAINYQILNNIKEINNNIEINDDINRIINASTCDKFKHIFNIYTSINSKEESNSNFNMNSLNNNFNNMSINNNEPNKNNRNFDMNEKTNSNNNNILNNNMGMNFNNSDFNPNPINLMDNSNNNNNFNQNMNQNNVNNLNPNMNLNNFNNFTTNNMMMPGMGMMSGMPMMSGMGMGMMPQMPMMGGMLNPNQNEEWLKGFQLVKEETSEIKIIFKTTQGYNTEVTVSQGTTIDQLLRKYLELENRSYLIGSKKICFLFNARQLKFGNNTQVEKFFKNVSVPKVVVNDVHYLIGEGNKYIRFKQGNGKDFSFKFGIGSTIEELLNYYFIFIGREDLTGSKDIAFLYNAVKLDSDLKTKVGNYFKTTDSPIIVVVNPKNLI